MAKKEKKFNLNPKIIFIIILLLVIIRVFGACAENAFKIPGLELFPDLIDWLENPFKQSEEKEYDSNTDEEISGNTSEQETESSSNVEEDLSVLPGDGSESLDDESESGDGNGDGGESSGGTTSGGQGESSGGTGGGGEDPGGDEGTSEGTGGGGEGGDEGTSEGTGGNESDDNDDDGGESSGGTDGGGEDPGGGGNENENESSSESLESSSESVNVDYISEDFTIEDFSDPEGGGISSSYKDYITVKAYVIKTASNDRIVISKTYPMTVICDEGYTLIRVILECDEGNFELYVDIGEAGGEIVDGDYVWTWEYDSALQELTIYNNSNTSCRVNKMTVIIGIYTGV